MRALSFTAGAMTLSLIAVACGGAASAKVIAPAPDPPAEQRPPPGTRVDTWSDLGVSWTPGVELPGSRDPFLWERPDAPTLPSAQVPLRLHRPID